MVITCAFINCVTECKPSFRFVVNLIEVLVLVKFFPSIFCYRVDRFRPINEKSKWITFHRNKCTLYPCSWQRLQSESPLTHSFMRVHFWSNATPFLFDDYIRVAWNFSNFADIENVESNEIFGKICTKTANLCAFV